MSPGLTCSVRVEQGRFSLDVDIRVSARSTALFGASGAGKTTILELIAGLRVPREGEISIGGRTLYSSAADVNVPTRLRAIGYVPQDLALFPHLSVKKNILYGADRPRHASVTPIAHLLEIDPLLNRTIAGLSAGERQRVALARALMSNPSLLLLDEPLASLDVPRRRRILPYLQRVRDELGTPILYVTHDASEVKAIAEHVIVLDEGRVVSSGSVEEFCVYVALPSIR